MTSSYTVFVDDNYHYTSEDSRYKLGDFPTYEDAVAKCKAIVDRCLLDDYQEGMSADALYEKYVAFGEDPFIIGEPVPFKFSAWDYAKERCVEICGQRQGTNHSTDS
jgi:hypothetical protein